MRRSLPVVVVLVALVVAASAITGCSRDDGSQTLTVFAAASLTESFDAMKVSGIATTFSYAGSGSLVAQIEQGASADVIATADAASMQRLADAGRVEPPVTFARNKLAILVQRGNPKAIKTVADLARPDIVFVTEDESVPAGKYAAQMFKAAGVSPNPKSKEVDVKAAVARVVAGEADATVVYVTDVKAAGSSAEGITIPDAQNIIATYPIAIVATTTHHDAAVTFINAVLSGPGREALRASGFEIPA